MNKSKSKKQSKKDQQISLQFASRTQVGLTTFSHIAPAQPSAVFDTYWRFASERQNVFFKRIERSASPWTNDPIIAKFKFTNAYRASDRVSQYLIQKVIYSNEFASEPEEIVFRILLFKLFNKIETWELLKNRLGNISFKEYSFNRYDNVLSGALSSGQTIYSAAYIMPSGGKLLGSTVKHRNHLRLIELMMGENITKRIGTCSSMAQLFELLRSYPTIGDFLAYQFATDLNYSELTDFSEMEFVMPGPGARDGIKKCFIHAGGLSDTELIRFMADRQEAEFERLGLRFRDLWGRRLQLIDCQNLFCEVDKYARVAHPDVEGVSGRARIKQKYSAQKPYTNYWYPPKWGINQFVPANMSEDSRWVAFSNDKRKY